MKNLYLLSAIILAALFTACQSTTPPATPTMPIPSPVPTEPPPPTPTQILPLEGEQQPTPQPATDAPIIAYNQIKEGQLNTPGEADEWVFNAKAGERVNIVLNSPFDSYLELLNPDGEFISGNDDNNKSLNAALFNVQINKGGPHTIVVRGFDGAMGNYVVALTGGHPTVGGGMVAVNEPRSVLLSEQGFKWRYQGQQGDFLTLSVTGAEGVDSVLSFYGPDGVLLATDDDSAGRLNPEIFEYQLPADGVYTVQARTIDSTGLATLTVAASPQPSGGGPIVIGTSQIGTLKPGREHRWELTGQAGQVINLSMISEEFDTFLELRNSQDVILAESDDTPDGTNAAISTFALPANDTYTVVARAATNSEGGNYEITLKPVKVAPGGGPLSLNKPTQAAIDPGQTNTWLFEAEANTFVTLLLQADLLDTYLELYGPDGELLIGDDDSGGGLNAAILNFPIPESGKYQAVVKSSPVAESQGGVYEILLTTAENLDTTGVLENGQSVEQELKAGEQHTWLFEAEEDSFATVQMKSPTLDTHLSLYDSSGELLSLNDDYLGKQAVIANFIIPATGEYRIVARSYSPEDEGLYTISLDVTDEEFSISRDTSPAPTSTPENE